MLLLLFSVVISSLFYLLLFSWLKSKETDVDLRESEDVEKTPYSMESFTPVSAEFNFSTSIFGQLTNDLQKILRVGETEGMPRVEV